MKEKIISIIFIFTLFSFSLASLIIKDKDISTYERRKLSSKETLKEDFISNLDDYLTDQFPLRDLFISTNSTFDRYILGNNDSNDTYIKDGFIIDKNYPLDEKNVNGFIEKINYVKENYLNDNRVFYSIIPDKAYFLNDQKYLKLDYTYLLNKLQKEINIPYIDIINLLTLDDYYKTDIHIKQDSYFKVIEKLSPYLEFAYQDLSYEEKIYNNFYGASYSKVPSFIKPDELKYMSNDTINNTKAKHLEYGEKNIYDIEMLSSADAYNIFLSGPSSIIEIENSSIDNNKELIIFRDSFASSMTPLLIPYYKKITLIDLRYINMNYVTNYVDFTNQDVLFLYSTLIVNDSILLKVNPK